MNESFWKLFCLQKPREISFSATTVLETQGMFWSVSGTERPKNSEAKGIFGGDPPDWWSAEERSRFFSSLHMAILHFSVTRTKAIWQRCPRAATHPHRLTSRLFLATYTVSRKSMENPNKKTTTGLAVWSMSFALFFGSREKVTG